jgi:hypothetical protein
MYRPLKTCIIRCSISFILSCILVMSTFSLPMPLALAAACIPATPLDASAGSANCDMSITAQVNPGVLTLANDATAVVTGTPFTLTGIPIVPNFAFTSIVKDHRGSTAGWALEAASAGITHATTTLALSLTAKDGPGTSCTNGTCTSATFTPITLSTTATRFLQAGNGTTTVVDGEYTNKTDGQFTIPPGAPSGSYTGTITITLLNTF